MTRFSFLRAFALAVLAPVIGLTSGCTIKVADSPDGGAIMGGTTTTGTTGSTGSSDGGATASTGSDAGGTSGSAGEGGGPCGAVTDMGSCSSTVLSFCAAGVLQVLDCASIGGTCEMAAGRADCTMGARESGCGTATELGDCDGAKVRFCDTRGIAATTRYIDCAAYGQKCDPHGSTADNGAACVPFGACPAGVTENGVCSANQLQFCEASGSGDAGASSLYKFDCGVDTCQTMAGFADCFATGSTTGCASETAAGHCSGNIRMACLGDTVASEDCAFLGLACKTDSTGAAVCAAGPCPTCPTGFACNATLGHCEASTAPTRDWTIMIYVVANNNLADAAWGNLNDMEKVGSTTAVQVVAQAEFTSATSFDGRTIPAAYKSPGVFRFPIQKDSDTTSVTSLAAATKLGDKNMSDPKTLNDFISSSVSQYPAKHYALVMWNHGGGFQGGFIDEGHNGFMSLKQLVAGVRDTGMHMDVIEFDACLMAMHEVGMAFRGVADVLVASEETEPSPGDPYDIILGSVVAKPTMTAAELGNAIVDGYDQFYRTATRRYRVTKSAVDLTKIGAMNAQLASLGAAIDSELSTQRLSVRNAIVDSSVVRYAMADYADLSTSLDSLAGLSGQTGSVAKTASDFVGAGIVLDKKATGDLTASGGLSVFLPKTGEYSSESLADYQQAVSPLPLQPWTKLLANISSDEAPPTQPGTGAVSDFSVVLSWGDVPDGKTSDVDLDLYVYEPNGDPAVPAIGTVSSNGELSGDSADTGVSQESYQLAANHVPGTYIVLAHYYGGPAGKSAYPTLQVLRSDLPGGSRTLVRAKVVDRKLTPVGMDNSTPLVEPDGDGGTQPTPITQSNFQSVLDLTYSDIWYAVEIEVK